MTIKLPKMYRSWGGWVGVIGVVFLLISLTRVEPNLWFIAISVGICLLGGLSFLYGQFSFALKKKEMVVIWWRWSVLTVPYKRMTAVRYRENRLQIRWQGRGSWASYWLFLPSQTVRDYQIYHQWIPIVRHDLNRWQEMAPERINLYILSSFVFMWFMIFVVTHGFWLMLVIAWWRQFDPQDWMTTAGMFAFLSLAVFGVYATFSQIEVPYRMTPKKIYVWQGFRSTVYPIAVPPPIERKRLVRKSRSGSPSYTHEIVIEQIIIYLAEGKHLILEGSHVTYSHLSKEADFNLLALHLKNMYGHVPEREPVFSSTNK